MFRKIQEGNDNPQKIRKSLFVYENMLIFAVNK